MTRRTLIALAAATAVSTTVGCSPPETPAPSARPATPAPAATPVPIVVDVQVLDEAGPEVEAWAEELRAAVSAGHGNLSLAASPEEASVVVRIDDVQTGLEMNAPPEGEGEISVMRGALVVDGSPRAFHLSYRGESRAQAEALARNLRNLAAEDGTGPATPPPTK
jgi:hypothetical protein